MVSSRSPRETHELQIFRSVMLSGMLKTSGPCVTKVKGVDLSLFCATITESLRPSNLERTEIYFLTVLEFGRLEVKV